MGFHLIVAYWYYYLYMDNFRIDHMHLIDYFLDWQNEFTCQQGSMVDRLIGKGLSKTGKEIVNNLIK